jgi:DNA topoisomerase I
LSKGLVIVESPAKAKTIQKYLGKGFTVEASLGHVKDLPKSTLGVDIDNEFETEYIVIPGKEKVLARLKKLALSADNIYLAPDPDREGEAIAWHLAEELGEENNKGKKKKKKKEGDEPDRIRRVTFNEITKRAVQEAFEHPRDIDQNLVDAQQARRVLDRLVGYQVSPLLWDKVRRGLSAGRVQTVALRLIVEREREIKAFQKVEYWTIDAHLAGPKPPAFDARFVGKGEEKVEVNNGEDAEKIRAALETQRTSAQCHSSLHYQQAAAGFFTQAALQREAHHDDRAAPL